MSNSYVAPRYLVTWSCDGHEAAFDNFDDALEEYRKHAKDRFGARVWGQYPDDTSDGLTDDEREQVEAVNEATVAFLEVG